MKTGKQTKNTGEIFGNAECCFRELVNQRHYFSENLKNTTV